MPNDQLDAAAFRRLLEHLAARTDVQNIDLMNQAGFCRNCLATWYQDAAAEASLPISKEQARERVYGMPFADWKARYQKESAQAQAFSHPPSKA